MSQLSVDLSHVDINALVADQPAYRWGRAALRRVVLPVVAVVSLLWLAGVVR